MPDPVHAHDARAHTLCAMVARTPFVVSRRVAFAVQRWLLSEWKYRQASRFLAVSKFVAHELNALVYQKKKSMWFTMAFSPVSHPPFATPMRQLSPSPRSIPPKAETWSSKPSTCQLPRCLFQRFAQRPPDASLFLYITRAEGLGSAALLSLAMGIPVIASDTGGLPEALAHGQAWGIPVPNNPPKIAAAIHTTSRKFYLVQTSYRSGNNTWPIFYSRANG